MSEKTQWLPHKGTRIVLLIVLVIVVLTAIIIRNRSSREIDKVDTPPDLLNVVTEQQQRLNLEDNDKDGLKAWEEDLWGTDPSLPDTDGDGTLDGDEVNTGRSPIIAGPEDKLHLVATSKDSSSEHDSTSTEEETQTALFAKTFISSYLNTKLYGDAFDTQVDTLKAIALPELEPVVVHKIEELSINSNPSKLAIHTYGNISGGILKKNAPGVRNELLLLLQANYENDPSYLSDLPITVEAYRKNADDLLKISVPKDIAYWHTSLINAFLLVARDIEIMALTLEDPLTSLSGFKSYVTSSENLTKSLRNIGVYLSNSTSYQNNENGLVLTNSI